MDTSLIRRTNQKTFSDIYSSYESFSEDFSGLGGVFVQHLSETFEKKTFYLLTAYYGDLAISGYRNETRWKLKLFALIAEYGPEWETKTDLQEKLRAMTIDQIKEQGLSIRNSAYNPDNSPSDASLKELQYISSQQTARDTVNDLEATLQKYGALADGLDQDYMAHFKPLFSKFLLKDDPLYVYES